MIAEFAVAAHVILAKGSVSHSSSHSFSSHSSSATHTAPKASSKPSSSVKPSTSTKPSARSAQAYSGQPNSTSRYRNSSGQTIYYRESPNFFTQWILFGWLFGDNNKCYDQNHNQIDCKKQ